MASARVEHYWYTNGTEWYTNGTLTDRFAVLPFWPFPFCRFAVSVLSVLISPVLTPFAVLSVESLIESIPFCRFRFDRFDFNSLKNK